MTSPTPICLLQQDENQNVRGKKMPVLGLKKSEKISYFQKLFFFLDVMVTAALRKTQTGRWMRNTFFMSKPNIYLHSLMYTAKEEKENRRK